MGYTQINLDSVILNFESNLMFTYEIIKDLIRTSGPTLHKLGQTYGRLPDTTCLRRGHCCALLPEMTFAEGLSAFRSLIQFEPEMQNRVFKKIVAYFFSNALEITSCPFLEGNHCLIYPERFFGCRAYGVWSPGYYENRAKDNQTAKKILQESWKRLGVALPKAVIEFQQPYCHDVTVQNDMMLEDATLEALGDRIELLSDEFGDWNTFFKQTYGSDISFLSAALVFGTSGAVQKKFIIVRDIIASGDYSPLDKLLDELPDITNRLI